MKRIESILVWLVVLVAAPAHAADTRHLQGLGNVHYEQFESKTLGRNLHVYVSLPDGYDSSDQRYPTIYLLDGGNLFPMLAPYYRYLNFGEEIPDLIIVGLSYGSDSFANGNLRSTDFTAPSEEREYWGGAEQFRAFLADELLPKMEQDFRSDKSQRIIFGQSLGGQFVIYSALTRPALFWGHIASNPAMHRNLPFFLEAHASPQAEAEKSKLFVASGTLDDPTFRLPAQAWIRHWQSADELPWTLRTMDLEGHSHMSAPPASFRQGLTWLFSQH